ncbi:MAG: HlyD family secretion protein, partial [Candidatus Aminicenantes bacterium]|nr:HlyD family secretion protein [Candidatus Aminicenantes bacterium]
MSKSRTGMIIAVGVCAALAVIIAVAVLKPKGGEEKEAAADMAVHIGTIGRATLRQFVTAYGVVMPQPASPGQVPADSEVAAPVSGIVAHIDCVEGQRVAKGSVLFRLDSRVAEVAVDKSKKALAFAEA